jgi:hypothetical protein
MKRSVYRQRTPADIENGESRVTSPSLANCKLKIGKISLEKTVDMSKCLESGLTPTSDAGAAFFDAF